MTSQNSEPKSYFVPNKNVPGSYAYQEQETIVLANKHLSYGRLVAKLVLLTRMANDFLNKSVDQMHQYEKEALVIEAMLDAMSKTFSPETLANMDAK